MPWLNRSLDLIDDPSNTGHVRHSQPAMNYICDENQDDIYTLNLEENFEINNMDPGSGQYMNTSNGSNPPPLPPRLESRLEYIPGGGQVQFLKFQPNQQQLQQQFQQMQQQHQMHPSQMQQQQMMSPFGGSVQRRSVAMDDMGGVHMTQSMNNELFIASFSDGDNSGEISRKSQGSNFAVDTTNSSGSSPAQKRNQQLRTKQPTSKVNQQKGNRRSWMTQPDVNRFTIAVRNLQKHVVELDQAVNVITKEVEDSKSDLTNVKSGLTTLKKDKDRLSDTVSIVNQEAMKMKDQVTASIKVCYKLQLVVT